MELPDTKRPFLWLKWAFLLLPGIGATLILLGLPDYGFLLTFLRLLILLAIVALATGMILLIRQINKRENSS